MFNNVLTHGIYHPWEMKRIYNPNFFLFVWLSWNLKRFHDSQKIIVEVLPRRLKTIVASITCSSVHTRQTHSTSLYPIKKKKKKNNNNNLHPLTISLLTFSQKETHALSIFLNTQQTLNTICLFIGSQWDIKLAHSEIHKVSTNPKLI